MNGKQKQEKKCPLRCANTTQRGRNARDISSLVYVYISREKWLCPDKKTEFPEHEYPCPLKNVLCPFAQTRTVRAGHQKFFNTRHRCGHGHQTFEKLRTPTWTNLEHLTLIKTCSLIHSFRFRYHSEVLYHISIQFHYQDFGHNEIGILVHLNIPK